VILAVSSYFFFQAEDGIRDRNVTGVQTCALPILPEITLADYSGVIVGGSPFNSSDPEQSKSPVQRRVEGELTTLLDEIVDRDFRSEERRVGKECRCRRRVER